jgi:hypothetical protein
MNFEPLKDIFNEKYNFLPVLDLKDEIGSTGYIDFIRIPDDNADNKRIVATEPVMRGYDKFKREFVTFRYNLYDDETDKCWQEVGTLFQRYSDNKYDWAYGTWYGHALYDRSRISLYDFISLSKRLKLLVAGETLNSIFGSINDEERIYGIGKLKLSLC